MRNRRFPGGVPLGLVCMLATPPVWADQETLRLEHVVVSHSGIGLPYAQAIGRTVAAARAIAAEHFGFDMPEVITVTVTVDPQASVRLFNDGRDRISLTVRSQRDLQRPQASGIFHLYGLCHEVAHLAMYRPIREHSWMTSAAAEGWAHYLGSRLVDEVYAREGEDLWPDRYNYRADGMQRLQKQLASAEPSDVTKGAGLWKDFAGIVGDKSLAPLFVIWGSAQVDPADPAKTLRQLLVAAHGDKQVADWWQRAEETLILKRPKSSFVAQTASRDQLAGEPRELAHDDGRQAGHKSIAGSGHAVRFEAPADSCYVISVRLHGSRYGSPAAPREDFHVWLCDEDFRALADFPFPYAKFNRGPSRWVTLRVRPTKVPRKFLVCVGFNPTATKGVFVDYDSGSCGNSLTGLPGGTARPFADGDWMIRATLDRLQAAASATRTWTDSTGKFSVEADYLGLEDGKVRLKRTDGTVIAVPIERLSEADRQYVRQNQPGRP